MQTPPDKRAWQSAYRDTVEALERIRAQELAAMTDEDALRCIESLSAIEPWSDRPHWSGLVEQQALFQRRNLP